MPSRPSTGAAQLSNLQYPITAGMQVEAIEPEAQRLLPSPAKPLTRPPRRDSYAEIAVPAGANPKHPQQRPLTRVPLGPFWRTPL